jgi:hypothetical protein
MTFGSFHHHLEQGSPVTYHRNARPSCRQDRCRAREHQDMSKRSPSACHAETDEDGGVLIESADNVLVRVELDSGHTGWAKPAPRPP